MQFLSCNTVVAPCLISVSLSLKCEKKEPQPHLLENSKTDGCMRREGMTSLGLRYTLTLSTFLQAYIQTETQNACTQLCPNSLRNEDGCTRARGVYMEENSPWASRRDRWRWWVWNRCQDVSVTSAQTQGGFQQKGFGKCVPVQPGVCFPTSVRLVPQSEAGDWVGSWNALDSNSILCLAAVWVQVCMHVFFFQDTMNSFVFSSTPPQTHTINQQ